MLHHVVRAVAIVLGIASAGPAPAQPVKAGLLTCDVSPGVGLIIGSKKQVSCVFGADQPHWASRGEDYDGSITTFGAELGATSGGVMIWAVFTDTAARPGVL